MLTPDEKQLCQIALRYLAHLRRRALWLSQARRSTGRFHG
jgi:hypothetical protein